VAVSLDWSTITAGGRARRGDDAAADTPDPPTTYAGGDHAEGCRRIRQPPPFCRDSYENATAHRSLPNHIPAPSDSLFELETTR
jgi:hypothetical protein